MLRHRTWCTSTRSERLRYGFLRDGLALDALSVDVVRVPVQSTALDSGCFSYSTVLVFFVFRLTTKKYIELLLCVPDCVCGFDPPEIC